MSVAKFTPGPWVAHYGEIVSENGWVVATVHGPDRRDRGKERAAMLEYTDANARLIAAAPEMYELLRRSARQLDADYPLDATRIMGVLARIDGDDS